MAADRCDKGPRTLSSPSHRKWPWMVDESCPSVCQVAHHIPTGAAQRRADSCPQQMFSQGSRAALSSPILMTHGTSASSSARPGLPSVP